MASVYEASTKPDAFGRAGLKAAVLLEVAAVEEGTSMGRGSGEGREVGFVVC